MSKKFFFVTIGFVFFIAIGLSISFQFLIADWNAPTNNPPQNNIGELINNGDNTQIKQGNLTIKKKLKVEGDLVIPVCSVGVHENGTICFVE